MHRMEIKKVNFNCSKDKLMVKSDEVVGKTASGIILPDSAKEPPKTGIVIACGPDTEKNPMPFKVGDRVLYSKFSGIEYELSNNEPGSSKTTVNIVDKTEIIGVITGEPIIELALGE